MAILELKNVIGEFSFTDDFKISKKKADIIIDESNIGQYKKLLFYFKDKRFFSKFYDANLNLMQSALENKKDHDFLIRETIKGLDQLFRARKTIADEELLKHLKEAIAEKESYLESLMQKYCPNLLAVADAVIGARLLHAAGSLEKLSRMVARKIQVLGAESAFFKFLTSRSQKVPRYGILFHNELVQAAKDKGRAARLLSDKIAIAVKVDFFKGEFVGDKLRKELDEKIY